MYYSFDNPYSFDRNPMGYETYIVQSGDTLYRIASRYGVSVSALKELNHLTSDLIYPNQVLFIPYKETNSMKNTYKTVEGDTLRKVFKLLNLNPACLKCYEPILDIELAPNQLVELVKGKREGNNSIVYKGESLVEFLADNNLTALDFIELNKDVWLPSGTRVNV